VHRGRTRLYQSIMRRGKSPSPQHETKQHFRVINHVNCSCCDMSIIFPNCFTLLYFNHIHFLEFVFTVLSCKYAFFIKLIHHFISWPQQTNFPRGTNKGILIIYCYSFQIPLRTTANLLLFHPTSRWRFVKELDMNLCLQALCPWMASFVWKHQTRPPGVALHLCPHDVAFIEPWHCININ